MQSNYFCRILHNGSVQTKETIPSTGSNINNKRIVSIGLSLPIVLAQFDKDSKFKK